MTGWEATIGAGIAATAAGSVWFDVRERRLPNALTVSALLVALGIRAAFGLPELGSGLAAAAVCLLLSLPLFVAGGLGGGDVKLLTAVGAFVGWEGLGVALAATALAGGAMALWATLRQGALGRTIHNLYGLIKTLPARLFAGRGRDGLPAPLTLDSPGVITIPYGVAIAVGGLTGWYLA